MHLDIATTIVLCAALLAAGWDLATRRIPNVLTFGMSAIAFAFWLWTRGLPGLGLSVAGWVVGCALFLPLFLLRGLGAGDVKLMAMIGSWVGPKMVVWTALYGAIAGGVLAMALALGHGYLRQAIINLGYLFSYWRSAGPRPVPALTLADAKGPRLAYAVPILVGMMAALWLQR